MTPPSPQRINSAQFHAAATAIAVLAALAEAQAEIADIIEDSIERINYRLNRTRERDRGVVIQAVKTGHYTVQDILEEVEPITDLSEHWVRKILKRLVEEGLVVTRRQNRLGSGSGKYATLYFLSEPGRKPLSQK